VLEKGIELGSREYLLQGWEMTKTSVEGRVFVCSWKRVGKRYRVWVKSRPKLAAEGRTFTEADEALWSAIIVATGDGENSREYEPRAPVDAGLEQFLQPALVALIGDDVVRVNAGGEYEGARCETCGQVAGRRSDKPLFADYLEPGFDAGFVIVRHPPFAARRQYIFSSEFLQLLRPAERKRFAWRKVERSKRAKRTFYELLDADVIVETVGVTGLPRVGKSGWRCEGCGFRILPHYVDWGWPYWVCAPDLPRRMPSCFGVRHNGDLAFCCTVERWRGMVGKRGTRGILSYEVGVVPPERCEREPKLRSVASIVRDLRRMET